MSIIKWRDSYCTGIEQFDQEHHKLVELIDMMYQAIRDHHGQEVMTRACEELIAYTNQHFANEEDALTKAGYPDLEIHKQEHVRLRKEVDQFQTRIGSILPDSSLEMYHFLRDWLIFHIMDWDHKYAPYLKDTLKQ